MVPGYLCSGSARYRVTFLKSILWHIDCMYGAEVREGRKHTVAAGSLPLPPSQPFHQGSRTKKSRMMFQTLLGGTVFSLSFTHIDHSHHMGGQDLIYTFEELTAGCATEKCSPSPCRPIASNVMMIRWAAPCCILWSSKYLSALGSDGEGGSGARSHLRWHLMSQRHSC